MTKDYIGLRFGELTVVAEAERAGCNRRLHCRCNCGSTTIKYLANLTQGKSRSCGCKWLDRSQKGRAAIIAARRLRSQESDSGRICLTCNTWKPWSDFSSNKRNSRGRASNCMECSGWRSMTAMFGISKEQWTWLLEGQNSTCGLCEISTTVSTRRFAVDHDHACCGGAKACTNCIRGLLCIDCNLMLGYVEKTEANRLRFSDYLKRRPFMESGDSDG